ncbi:glycoside hydrolase superfamily [Scheffersomyces xylosifermentans]|uniref:glycoside hydrolase superfamily n=1 Tax=Scheffersomyces xylosifermentans TaxID=1304137 RepID=UPI00315D6F3D
MFDKLKLKSKSSNLTAASPAATPGKPPSKKQIYQSRKNFGVNIGACFVLEKWIFHELFPDGAECELDVVEGLVKSKGNDGAREAFEKYWSDFLTDDDWKWLKDNEVTSIRVPLGYWDIGGGNYTKGTKFEKYGSTVYANAWKVFKEKFVERARDNEISVLVDIHGLPGGANGSDHSGEKSGGEAKFWSSQDAQLTVLNMLAFIADDLKNYENIAGLQIVNEAEFADEPAKKQSTYYAAAINSIREKDSSIPIVISDGWWADQWARWVQSNQSGNKSLGVVIDHHCYRCFSDDDKKKAPPKIIDDLQNDLLTNLTDNGKGVDFMVGEYSCVLDGASWDRDNANRKRDQLVIDYGNRQVELINERAGFGSYFWTYKFQSGNGGEWDFKTMIGKGAIKHPKSIKGKELPDKSKFDEKLNNVFEAHKKYWDNENPKEKYEHDRYKEGFTTAWADASEFAKFNGSVLGRKEAWKSARLEEHIKARGSSRHLWEWEQGFDAGLNEFLNFF